MEQHNVTVDVCNACFLYFLGQKTNRKNTQFCEREKIIVLTKTVSSYVRPVSTFSFWSKVQRKNYNGNFGIETSLTVPPCMRSNINSYIHYIYVYLMKMVGRCLPTHCAYGTVRNNCIMQFGKRIWKKKRENKKLNPGTTAYAAFFHIDSHMYVYLILTSEHRVRNRERVKRMCIVHSMLLFACNIEANNVHERNVKCNPISCIRKRPGEMKKIAAHKIQPLHIVQNFKVNMYIRTDVPLSRWTRTSDSDID